jgi:preprotein translocase subunit YajC
MPGSATAEVIFIGAMMILILVISFAAVFFFVKTYRKEMKQKEERKQKSDMSDAKPQIK